MPARDALLLQHNAPVWLLGKPQAVELGEASPSLIHTAKALASPLGLDDGLVPDLLTLVWEGFAADTAYAVEVPRFLRIVDFMVRVCAPVALEHYQRADLAAMLREAPAIRDEDSFYTLLCAVIDATRMLGDARTFEARAVNLQEALRVRAVGFGVVAIKHAQTVIEAGFEPRASVPEMRELHLRFLPVLAGARSVVEHRATVDAEALTMYKDLVRMRAGMFESQFAQLQRYWDRTAPKAS